MQNWARDGPASAGLILYNMLIINNIIQLNETSSTAAPHSARETDPVFTD